VVQSQTSVGRPEVGGAVAPPGEELLRLRRRRPDQVGEVPGLAKGGHGLDLHGRMADHPEHLAVTPDVELAGRHIQVAGDHQGCRAVPPPGLSRQAGQEVELVGELGVCLRVRDIAPRRDVEVLHLHALDPCADAPGMPLPAEVELRRILEGKAREDGHSVRPLLPGDAHVRIARRLEGGAWKLPVPALDLLEAKDVRGLLGEETRHLLCPQAHGVDVPGGESQGHGRSAGRPAKKRPEGASRPGVVTSLALSPEGDEIRRQQTRRRQAHELYECNAQ